MQNRVEMTKIKWKTIGNVCRIKSTPISPTFTTRNQRSNSRKQRKCWINNVELTWSLARTKVETTWKRSTNTENPSDDFIVPSTSKSSSGCKRRKQPQSCYNTLTHDYIIILNFWIKKRFRFNEKDSADGVDRRSRKALGEWCSSSLHRRSSLPQVRICDVTESRVRRLRPSPPFFLFLSQGHWPGDVTAFGSSPSTWAKNLEKNLEQFISMSLFRSAEFICIIHRLSPFNWQRCWDWAKKCRRQFPQGAGRDQIAVNWIRLNWIGDPPDFQGKNWRFHEPHISLTPSCEMIFRVHQRKWIYCT